ncbi:separin-like, partial [Rhincodon typus]
MAALYRLMDKPFQVIESYGLMLRLLDPCTDSLPLANVLLQLGETLLSVDCLDEVQTCLARAELLLKEDNSGKGDHHLLAKTTCTLLRSQLLLATSQVPEGLTPLLEVLTCPSLHKSSKAWYLLKAKVQQLVAAYLSLPPSALPASLRRRLQQHGWRSPESALTDAHKMLCGIVMLVCPGVLSFGKRSSELNCPASP